MALVVYDGFSAALEHVLKNLPDEFEFCVAGYRFRDFASIVQAREVAGVFKNFERTLHAKGYAIKHSYEGRDDMWVYTLKRTKPPEPAALPAKADAVIDV